MSRLALVPLLFAALVMAQQGPVKKTPETLNAEIETDVIRARLDLASSQRRLAALTQTLELRKLETEAVLRAARADAAALIEGQAATQRLLAKALERAGIVELNPQGEPFDANLHEAMAAQPSATAEPNSVLAVVQRGYSLNGRLLRAARVVIARAPE